MNSRFYSQDRRKLKHMIGHIKVLTNNLEKLTAEISTLKNGWIIDQSQNRVTKEKEFTCNKSDTFWIKSINTIQGFLRKLYFRSKSKENIPVCSNNGEVRKPVGSSDIVFPQSNCVAKDKKSTARRNEKNEKKDQCCQTFSQLTRLINKNVATSSETRIPRKSAANYHLLSSNSVDCSTNENYCFREERISLNKSVQTTLLKPTVGNLYRTRVINKKHNFCPQVIEHNSSGTLKNKLKENRCDYGNDSCKPNIQGNYEYLRHTNQPFLSQTPSSNLQCEQFSESNNFCFNTDDERSFSTSTLSVNLQFSICSSTVPSFSSANRMIPEHEKSYILQNNDSVEQTQLSTPRNRTFSVTNCTLQHKNNNLNEFKKLESKHKTSNERFLEKGILPKIILLKCKKSRGHAWYKTQSYLYYSSTSSSSSQTSSNTIMNCKTSNLGCKIK